MRRNGAAAKGVSRAPLGTKAEVLGYLSSTLRRSRTLPQLTFTRAEWLTSHDDVVTRADGRLPPGPLLVRSSASDEDTEGGSNAGRYRSVAVDGSDRGKLSSAIASVFAAMDAGRPGAARDQVLVQPLLTGAAAAGVVTSRALDSGSPYYVIALDRSGRTDVVTAGGAPTEVVAVWRGSARHHRRLRTIATSLPPSLLPAVREVERRCRSDSLDVEFAIDGRGDCVIFQARPIAAQQSWRRDVDRATCASLRRARRDYERAASTATVPRARGAILSNMADWNPAEVIGARPLPLAYDLYQTLLTGRTWSHARAAFGYRPVSGALMLQVGGHAYVDLARSFSSFIPVALDARVARGLVSHWCADVARRPELHDKVEFSVATTCLDFRTEPRLRASFPSRFSAFDRRLVVAAFRALTNDALSGRGPASIASAMARVRRLRSRQDRYSEPTGSWLSAGPDYLLGECRTLGTYPFAILARHAFVAEAMLRSLAERGAVDAPRLAALRSSFNTVTQRMLRDVERLRRGSLAPSRFFAAYGHLRPNSYDVRSLRYADVPELVLGGEARPVDPRPAFQWTRAERRAIRLLASEVGLDLTPDSFLAYLRSAIVGREEAKFVFTRHLSHVLETFAAAGAGHGLGRDDIAHLTLTEAAGLVRATRTPAGLDRVLRERRRRAAEDALLILGGVIASREGLVVSRLPRDLPNFVGTDRVSAPSCPVSLGGPVPPALSGAIVCVERADPGYDWLFAHGIVGLVTQFGGTNSHMAVRCAELGIPAALGCGPALFSALSRSAWIELDCAAQSVRGVEASGPRAR